MFDMTDLNIYPGWDGFSVESVSADQFKLGMRNLAGAVNVITVIKGEVVSGLTATAVMSVSAEPPRVIICINKDVFAHSLITIGSGVCINTLDQDQIEQAKIFAGMCNDVSAPDRFNHGSWLFAKNKAPELHGALLIMQCRVIDIISAYSHSMILCEVYDVKYKQGPDKKALLYFDGCFSTLKDIED